MITPQEIRQQTFRRAMRGYDREEVNAFMQAMAQEWEAQQHNLKEVREELERTKASYRTLKEVEDMLHRTLMQAEQSARDTVENARQKAELKIREAEARSQEVLRQGVEDRSSVQREIEELIRRRDHLYTQMQIYLQTQLERLQDFDRAELPSFRPSTATLNGALDTSPPKVSPAPPNVPPAPQQDAEGETSFFDDAQAGAKGQEEGAGQDFDDLLDEL